MTRHYLKIQKKLILLLFLCLLHCVAWAQSVLRGKVSDPAGSPLSAVTVQNQSSKASSSTGEDGTFSISANPGDQLLFRNVGYASYTLKVVNLSNVQITLTPEDQNLEEVVVLGYGSIKKSNLTGSVSRLDKRVLETGVRSNPASALAGTIPGLRVQQTSGKPGAVPRIVLRGGTTYGGGGEPLIIVDGVIRASFSDISQDDIESIDVLKDASATAIYGARASNGVILVTTKRGKEGVSNITLRSKTGLNYINQPFEFLGAKDYITWSRKAVQTSGIYQPNQLNQLTAVNPFGTGNKYKDANGNILDGNQVNTAVWSTMLLDDTNRELLSQGWQTMIDPVTGKELIFKDFNYADYAVNDGAVTQDYNLGLQGGNDKGKYYASIGKYKEDGLPIETYYDRLTFVLNGDYKIKPWLTSNSGLNFAHTKWKDANNDETFYFSRALGAPPTMRGTNANGDLLLGRDNWDGNPMVNIDKFIRDNLNQKFTFSQAFTINLAKNLSLRTSANWYINQDSRESFAKDYLNGPGNWVRSRASSASNDKRFNQTYNAVLNYNLTIQEDHNFDAMAGWEFYDAYRNGLSASGNGAPTDDFMDLQLTNSEANRRSIDSWHDRQRITSFFGRVNYDYKQRYLMTLTLRRDGYSALLNNRWGNFPGVSLGWNMHNEEFFANSIGKDNIVNTLKLRASYGANGNISDITKDVSYLLQGTFGTSKYNGNVGYLMNSLNIPNLKWESLITKEVGLETRLLNRVDLSVAYYHRTTSDKIADLKLPASAGWDIIRTNNGDMQNHGVEIDLNYQAVRSDNWDLSFNWNTAYNQNKILKLPNNGLENNRQNAIQVYNPSTKELEWVGGFQEGQDPNVAYAYEAIGIIRNQADLDSYARNLIDYVGARPLVHPDVFNAMSQDDKNKHFPIAIGDVMWRDVNGDGVINTNDQVKMGNTIPRFTGGFGLNTRYKDLSLSARFDYALGFIAYDGPRAWFLGMMQGTFNTTTEVLDSWTPENPNAKYPTYYWADQLFKNNVARNSSMFFNKGNYLALREIALAYSLPKSIANKAKMEDLKLTVSGQNLQYWTKNTLFSAESGSVAQGSGGYPLPRTVIFGVQLTF